MSESRLDDIPFDEPIKDGEYKAYLYKKDILEPYVDFEFEHGLTHPPIKIQLVYSSERIKYPQIVFLDEKRVILNFDVAATVIMRFE
jgi:hypothetical protein